VERNQKIHILGVPLQMLSDLGTNDIIVGEIPNEFGFEFISSQNIDDYAECQVCGQKSLCLICPCLKA
jgi:hypothetical protein